MAGADTIFALATPPGRGAVAIIRISGPRAVIAAAALTGRPPRLDRTARLRRIVDPRSGEMLDEALLLGFASGASFTGEDSVELQMHGAPVAVARVLDALAAQQGLRRARPGEFARRALENGRLDLTRAEAIADLVDAETETQHRQAIGGLSGQLARRAESWRAELLSCLALLEAEIDFADEGDTAAAAAAVRGRLSALHETLRAEAGQGVRARRVREGVEVAIVGPPNAGKSSLINSIAGREVALTDAAAGTTRDVLEATVALGGVMVTFLDTAGLRDAAERVEAMGVARARARAEAADIRVIVSTPALEDVGFTPRPGDLRVVNKIDLQPGLEGVSARTGEGIDALLDQIATRAAALVGGGGVVFRERHVAALTEAAAHVNRAIRAEAEIAAEELRLAIGALDALLGRIDAEEVLGEIFARFCIGK